MFGLYSNSRQSSQLIGQYLLHFTCQLYFILLEAPLKTHVITVSVNPLYPFCGLLSFLVLGLCMKDSAPYKSSFFLCRECRDKRVCPLRPDCTEAPLYADYCISALFLTLCYVSCFSPFCLKHKHFPVRLSFSSNSRRVSLHPHLPFLFL